MFVWTGSTGSTPHPQGRSTRYSDRSYHFSVTIPRCYKDAYVNSFFPRTAKLYQIVQSITYDENTGLKGVKFNSETI